MVKFYVDCEICAHYEDVWYCVECLHNNFLTEDNFEPLSEQERTLKAIPTENIVIEGAQAILSLFEKARKFTINPLEGHLSFVTVYFDEDKLVSSDIHRLVEIKCNYIPPELRKKHVLDISESGEVRIVQQQEDHPFEDDKYQRQIKVDKSIQPMTKADLLNRIEPFGIVSEDDSYEKVIYLLGEAEPVLKKQYSDDALELFAEDELIEVHYSHNLAPVILKGKDILIVILPLRVSDELRKERKERAS